MTAENVYCAKTAENVHAYLRCMLEDVCLFVFNQNKDKEKEKPLFVCLFVPFLHGFFGKLLKIKRPGAVKILFKVKLLSENFKI